MQRFLLNLLWCTQPPQTLAAADAVMLDMETDPRNRVVATMVRKTVRNAFQRLRKAGHVTGVRFGAGQEMERRLA